MIQRKVWLDGLRWWREQGKAATAWRPNNLARVKKKVLTFSWTTNQAMMVILRWRIKSILNKLLEVIWYIWSKFTSIEWNQVTYSRWLCSRKKSKLTCWHPHLMKIESYDIWIWRKKQLKRFKFLSHLILSK